MANRRGRRPMDDRAALRRVAEYIVAAEERGARCSTRAAILGICDRVAGNSPGAVLWRLQRKWRSDGAALLAEVKERQAMRRRALEEAVIGPARALEEAMSATRRFEDQVRRTGIYESEIMRAHRTFEQLTRRW